MASTKVDIDKLADSVSKILIDWSEELADGVKKDVKTVADETRDEIKLNSPEEEHSSRKGRYKKGWSDKVSYEDSANIRVTVYNKTDYQLAHLLEYGHEIVRNGKTVGHANAKPHIRPAEKHAEEKLVNKVVVRIKKG